MALCNGALPPETLQSNPSPACQTPSLPPLQQFPVHPQLRAFPPALLSLVSLTRAMKISTNTLNAVDIGSSMLSEKFLFVTTTVTLISAFTTSANGKQSAAVAAPSAHEPGRTSGGSPGWV